MKTFLLKDLTEEGMMDIMSFLDTIETNNEEGQIYINSGGGSIWIMDCILTRLEELKDKEVIVKLRGVFMASAAFELFHKYTGSKRLECNCDAIVHVTATNLHVFNSRHGIKIRSDDHIELKRFSDSENTFHYDFLTEEEKMIFNEGRDVYLNYERLKTIFNK